MRRVPTPLAYQENVKPRPLQRLPRNQNQHRKSAPSDPRTDIVTRARDITTGDTGSVVAAETGTGHGRGRQGRATIVMTAAHMDIETMLALTGDVGVEAEKTTIVGMEMGGDGIVIGKVTAQIAGGKREEAEEVVVAIATEHFYRQGQIFKIPIYRIRESEKAWISHLEAAEDSMTGLFIRHSYLTTILPTVQYGIGGVRVLIHLCRNSKKSIIRLIWHYKNKTKRRQKAPRRLASLRASVLSHLKQGALA